MGNKTATYLNEADDMNGHASVYRMDPPHPEGHELVVVSAVSNMYATETYLFPSEDGRTVSTFSELQGSIRGVTCHTTALESIGYTVVVPA